MLERRIFCSFYLLAVVFALAIAAGQQQQQRRLPGSGQSPSRTRLEPVVEATESPSNVEYVNDGPLGALYDFLIQNNLLKLCQLLRKANLEEYLVNSGAWTLFAPTDGSFAFLPGGTLDEFDKNPDMMREFLLHHFVSGDISATQMFDEMVVNSFQGAPLRFNIYGPPDVTTVSGAEIMTPDLQFDLGRVHIVDRPLYPFSNYDLLGYLQTYHNEMYKLIINSGLAEFLSGGIFTIFAPDDKAFEYLSLDFKEALVTNESLAQGVVLTHVLPASMFVRGLANGVQLNSVGNADLLFTQRRGLTFVNGVPILTPDVPVSNGVVHVVNRLLLPEGINADCQCRPFDYTRGTSQRQPGFPYEPSRMTPTQTPRTEITGSPQVRRPGSSIISGHLPGFQTSVQGQRQPSSTPSRQGQLSRQSVSVPTTTTAAPTTSRVVPTVAAVPPRRVPFNPNRIPASRTTLAPVGVQEQWNTRGDTSMGELEENFDNIPTNAPPLNTRQRRPVVVPTVRPQRVQQTRPQAGLQITRRPGQATSFPSPSSFEDNSLDSQSGVSIEDDFQLVTEAPGFQLISSKAGRPQPQQRPFQTTSGGHRQQIVVQQRPGQSQVQPIQTPGQPQQPIRPVHRPTQIPGQQPQVQPARIGQPVQRPGQPIQIQPGQRPGQPIQIQSVQRPGQPTQIQPTQRPLQLQPTRRPIQPSQIQPIQRPGQSVRFQPGQQPGFQPGQQPAFQPGQQPGFQPGQQPAFQPGQQPAFQPGQQPGFQPSRRPLQPIQPAVVATDPSIPATPTRRTPPPPQPPTIARIPAQVRPGFSPQISVGRQQVTPTTSLFPTRRPGHQDHSTKGQTYNPQRQSQRRPPSRIAPVPPPLPQARPVPVIRGTTPIRTPGSGGHVSSCRQRSDPITATTQSLPLCPPTVTDLEPCQRLDAVYDPTDPRPPCDGIEVPLDCKPPGLPFDLNDPRPECPEIEIISCRMPDESTFLGDRRPLCEVPDNDPFSLEVLTPSPRPSIRGPTPPPVGRRRTNTVVPEQVITESPPPPTNCRNMLERPLPGDRRPLCRPQSARPTSAPITTPPQSTQTVQPNCRPLNERPAPGDRRPVCSLRGTQRPAQPGRVQPQRPIRPQPVPTQPTQRPTQPIRVEEEFTEQPDIGPITDAPIQEFQTTTRQPSLGQFTTRRSVQPVNRQPSFSTTRRPITSVNFPTTQAPRHQSTHQRQPIRPISPANQPVSPGITSIRTNEIARRRPVVQPIAGVQGTPASPGVSPLSVTTSTTSAVSGQRTLFEIVEDPALLIQGRPVKLTKILELFQKAGLEYILTDPGPYTVFLPSDDAFLRLPKGVIEQLEADPFLLQQVLLFHVTNVEVLPGPQDDSYTIPSFQGTPILITMLKGGRMILISGAKAVAVTKASNGIFYVINQLLYPLPQDDIVSALNTRPDLTTISSFLEMSGLNDMISGDQPYTIFAPTDIAFSQLSEYSMQELMQNTTALRELLSGHIISGAHYGREFLSGVTFPSLRGDNLKVNTVSWGYQVNNVNIKTPEIVTGRGVIHVIDEVLLSPSDAKFIEKLTNTIDGVVPPQTAPERLSSPQRGSVSTGHSSSQPASGGWRSQTYSVSYDHTSMRRNSMTSGVQLHRPVSPNNQPQLIRHTTIFTLPGSPQRGSLVSGGQPPSNTLVNQPQTTRGQHAGTGHQQSTRRGSIPRTQDAAIPPSTQGDPSLPAQFSSVAQLASDIGLNQFASYIMNTGLSEKIEDGGTYTIFAPTDEALNALPPDVRQAIDADPNQLRSLLQYHILPQKISTNSIGNDQTASTLLEGQKLRLNVYNGGQVLTALGVPVEQPQDDASTIRLIPVNQVLQPPSGNLLKIIESYPELSQFSQAIKNAHLNWMLSGESGITLFAPTDAAFQALSEETKKILAENRREFTELLKSHIVRGTLYSSGLQDGEQRSTENRKTLQFNFNEVGMEVNAIPVTQADIPATNGVLYIIDGFL